MSATGTRTDPARLYRTTRVFAEALERRRAKIAAGIEIEPPPECGCAKHREAEVHDR